ncbi:transposase DNA-binding-containing protein, partial [Legionella pneumophila serogroup 6]
MELAIEDATAWSEAIFGSVDLGDKRLTKRLIQMGKQLSSLPGSSLSASCEGQDALLEGSYGSFPITLNLLHILPKRKKHDQIHLFGGDGWNLRLKMQRPGLKRFLV